MKKNYEMKLFRAYFDFENIPEAYQKDAKKLFMKSRRPAAKVFNHLIGLVNRLWGNKSAWGPNGDDFDPDYIKLVKRIIQPWINLTNIGQKVHMYIGDDADLYGTMPAFKDSKITFSLGEETSEV